MKELTFGTMLAVFEEMFGSVFFWILALLALAITMAYAYVLIRDRTVSMKKFFWAQISMPFGAIAAVALVLGVTNSQLADLGGPIDVILFIAIAVVGAIGISILLYTVQSLIWPPVRKRD